MSFNNLLAEDRRLVILRSLEEIAGNTANDSVLRTALEHVGHQVGRDIVRADLTWLEEHSLVSIEKMTMPSGVLWRVQLTEAGEDVARGRFHPGVKRKGAGI